METAVDQSAASSGLADPSMPSNRHRLIDQVDPRVWTGWMGSLAPPCVGWIMAWGDQAAKAGRWGETP